MESLFEQAALDGLFAGGAAPLRETDPELRAIWEGFALGDVAARGGLPVRERALAVLAGLMGCQGLDAFRAVAPAALKGALSPIELRELVYHATAYLGLGRVYPFLAAANAALTDAGETLPLPPQGTTDASTRRAAGTQAQVDIFGEGMADFWRAGPEDSRHINLWLAANCFGDYYTRQGLGLRERELVTFCLLAAQGGCEPQLTSHAAANLRMGNDAGTLIAALSHMLPYLGYPRTLNALRCVREAEKK